MSFSDFLYAFNFLIFSYIVFLVTAKARDSISSTYDTFVPTQPPGLDELIKLQEHVKTGALSIDDALDQFNDWQRLQRGMDSIQQVIEVQPLLFHVCFSNT